ncbi:hypothetical protein Micbo1qcDRAFT_162685, partial [Microdochium bolleyi]
MSKAPLLLRSSPGFGTGSYGAAPIPPATDDLEDDLDQGSDGVPQVRSRRSRRRKSIGTSRSH